jgi:peptide/nickel transport system ATP-binding protein
VLDLLADIRQRLRLAMVFITHDLRVAAQVCDTVAVMRLGRIVEHGPTAQVFGDPQHPYTRELMDAIPGKRWIAPDLLLHRDELLPAGVSRAEAGLSARSAPPLGWC